MDASDLSHHLEQNTADKLAKLVVENITNDKGEILARVWENQGF